MYTNHELMKKGRGRGRQLKAKGPRKISTITLYSKNACKQHITSN
jgi:hypothetical protein